MRTTFALPALVAGLVACSSSGPATTTSTHGDGGMVGSSPCPTKYGSLVIVGDSISADGSGENLDKQQPLYRELLVQNDDARYPDFRGKDLTACQGMINTVKVSALGAVASEDGAVTSTGYAPVLFDQVKSLPNMLPGPVLVVGTIGMNDMLRFLPNAVIGQDISKNLATFAKGLDDAFAELTKQDRFGAGVKVDVLVANIYDPSGSTADFKFGDGTKCPGELGYYPAGVPTDPLLKPWNDVMATEATKFQGVRVLDAHALFTGHGVPAMDGWIYADCVHPSSIGHERMRELFWQALTTR